MKVVRKRPASIHEEIANNYHSIVGDFSIDSHNEPEQQEDKQAAVEEENLHQRRQARIQRMIEDEPERKTSSSNGNNSTLYIAVLFGSLLFILVVLSSKHTRPSIRQVPDYTISQPISNVTDSYMFRQSVLDF